MKGKKDKKEITTPNSHRSKASMREKIILSLSSFGKKREKTSFFLFLGGKGRKNPPPGKEKEEKDTDDHPSLENSRASASSQGRGSNSP